MRVKTPEGGRFAGQQVLAHVAGTLDPVVTGMRSWAPVEVSTTSGAFLDLSNGSWQPSDPAGAEGDAREAAEAVG